MFSNAANNSGEFPISEGEVKRVLASAEGRQLLALLRSDGSGALGRAIEAAQRGDLGGARKILEPVLNEPQAAALMEKLRHG